MDGYSTSLQAFVFRACSLQVSVNFFFLFIRVAYHTPLSANMPYSGVRTGGGGFGGQNPPFGDGTESEDLSFYFNDPLRTELAEIANMSLLFDSPV